MPLKTFSALSSTTSFFLPLGILNSPQNLSKLKGSLQPVPMVPTVPIVPIGSRSKIYPARKHFDKALMSAPSTRFVCWDGPGDSELVGRSEPKQRDGL